MCGFAMALGIGGGHCIIVGLEEVGCFILLQWQYPHGEEYLT